MNNLTWGKFLVHSSGKKLINKFNRLIEIVFQSGQVHHPESVSAVWLSDTGYQTDRFNSDEWMDLLSGKSEFEDF